MAGVGEEGYCESGEGVYVELNSVYFAQFKIVLLHEKWRLHNNQYHQI